MPHFQQMPSGSWSDPIEQKIGALLHAGAEYLTTDTTFRTRLRSTSKHRNSMFGPALLLANGPSMRNVLNLGLDRLEEQGLPLAVMNDFFRLPEAEIVSPDYYFLVDPWYWEGDNAQEVCAYLERRPGSRVVQPAKSRRLSSNPTLFVNHIKVAGLWNASGPIGPSSYPESVALMALSVLRYLGHYPVYVAGLDVSTFRFYGVDSGNRVWGVLNGMHAYSPSADGPNPYDRIFNELCEPGESGARLWDTSQSPIRDMSDMLYSHAVMFRELKRLAGDFAVNVGGDRTNDVLPRACLYVAPAGDS